MHTRLHSCQTVRNLLQAGKPAAVVRAWLLRPWLLLSLCGAASALAQDAARDAASESPAPLVPVAVSHQTAQPVPPAIAVPPDSSPLAPAAAAAPELQSVSTLQGSLPAGVCPVISDYLLQQCQQNPADPMCSFVPGA